MSAESSLYALLVADPDVMALIEVSGASPSEARAFPHKIRADQTLPAVSYTRPTTEFNNTIHGLAPTSAEPTLEITCVAATRTAADGLADAVLAAIVSDFIVENRFHEERDDEPEYFATVLIARTSETLA